MNKQTDNKQWFGAYDSNGKLRAMLESESEAYFYIRNRGHVNGGSYKAIPDSWHLEAIDAIAQHDAAVAALRAVVAVFNARKIALEAAIAAAIAAAEKGQ